jgi:hypothetical protein
MMPDQRFPNCRAAFNVARAEDLPKNLAVLGILQSAQRVPRARDCPPAPPLAAKGKGARIPAAAAAIPPGVKPDSRHVVSAQTEDSRCVLLPPPHPPTPPHPQLHNGFIYMTARAHVAKSRVWLWRVRARRETAVARRGMNEGGRTRCWQRGREQIVAITGGWTWLAQVVRSCSSACCHGRLPLRLNSLTRGKVAAAAAAHFFFRAHFETCAFTTEHHSQKPCLYVVLNVLLLQVRPSDDDDDNYSRSSKYHIASLDSLADEGCGLKLRDGSGRM